MKTVIQRLVDFTNSAVFDKGADAELALRISHASGTVWSVADETLTVKAGGGSPVSFDLAAHTIESLAAALVGAGFHVPLVSTDWASRSALVLVEGGGNSVVSNGDHVTAFTSLLWALMSGYAVEIRAAQYQISQALRQMQIPQAEGYWLDVWGALYGIPRLQDESDTLYQGRIARDVFRRRSNTHSIELAIRQETGWEVLIEEPWRDMFRLDSSRLSSGHAFYDGVTIGYHLLRPVALEPVDWPVVLSIIERNKPAGVVVIAPVNKPLRVFQDSLTYTSREWRGSRRTWATANATWAGLAPMTDDKHSTW